ncbi:glycosyltransferase family 2 protein [Candidatus Woesearchaeota archaeon]|nr:glycosyltransferase family 2 protein [Candidatus Woesearchaeota archaeon]
MISVIIPVYNEEKAVASTIERVKKAMNRQKQQYEIIAVNDGSTDNSEKILRQAAGIRIASHPYNLGYGAALKTGLRNAKGEFVLITDADGTYPVESIPELLKYTGQYDMVVGARTGKNVPNMRKPAKAIIGLLANILTGKKIPDLNSGFRVFRKEVAMQFMHLYPSGFSFTITITLACLTNSHTVKYVPIEYSKRQGKSTISPVKDFIGFVTLIVRILTYFEPLKFFLTPAILLILAGIGYGIYQLVTISNIAQLPVLLVLAGLQIGLLGLVADLIAKSRR